MSSAITQESQLHKDFLELIPGAEELGNDLLRRWGEPWRGYHNQQHLQESLSACADLGGGPIEALALWFHDAVYGLGSGDDERASAELARESLTRAGLPADQIAEVVRLVLITEHHQPELSDPVGCRVSDADMAILASAPARYAESVAGIRREYARYDDAAFNAGRIQVLEGFLSGLRIFFTDQGSAWWEVAARRNIAEELRQRRRHGWF